MAVTSTTSTPVGPAASRSPVRASRSAVDGSAAVLAGSSLGVAALVADAATGQARLALLGLAAMALALAWAFTQAVQARVGRPWRSSRLAARAGRAASLFVAVFLACVGVLERMGPEVVESALFAAGVAVMSAVLLVVLPLALVVLGWGVVRDRRLRMSVRVLPWALLVVVAAAVVAVAVTDGSQELWLQAAAGAAAGVVLTGFSAGLPRAGSRSALRDSDERAAASPSPSPRTASASRS